MTTTDSQNQPLTPSRARPIVLYLVVLALVAFVPVMAFSAVLLQRNNEAQQEVVQTLILATTDAVSEAVDRQIDGMITTLKGFASAPMATGDDLRNLQARADSVLEGTGTYLTLVGADGHGLVNTRFPYGAAPPSSPAVTAIIQQALAGNQTLVADATYGAAVKTWVLPIFMPIKLPNGTPAALTITQNAQNLGTLLLTRQMPDGWRIALVDTKNNVIASSPIANMPPGAAFFVPPDPQADGQHGWRHVLADDHALVVVSSITKAGWRVVAWAPAAAVERPLSNSLLTLIIGGIVIVVAATVATFFLSREISRSVRGLARDARRLGAGETVPTRDYPVAEIAEVAAAIAQAARQRQASEAEVRFLMRELAHRSKNQMTVIAAMAKQTARGADSVPEFVASFERRIFGLARSTDLLLANGVAGVDLRELLGHQIDPFCPLDGERVDMEGPSVRLNTQAAQILGMAGHELATNAAKYGAFASDDGRLVLTWRLGDGRLVLNWRERVPALAKRPERRGFGTTVLENMVGSTLGATVTRTLHADGIEWNFDIPVESLDPNRTPEGRPSARAAEPRESAAAP